MKLETKSFTAWAVATKSRDQRLTPGIRLLGRYWWFDGKPPVLPEHLAGCTTALFETRAKARAAAKRSPGYDSATYPIKVRVTLEAA